MLKKNVISCYRQFKGSEQWEEYEMYVGKKILRLKNCYRWQKIWKLQNWFECRKRTWNCEISLTDSSKHSRNEHEYQDCKNGFDQRYEYEGACHNCLEQF